MASPAVVWLVVLLSQASQSSEVRLSGTGVEEFVLALAVIVGVFAAIVVLGGVFDGRFDVREVDTTNEWDDGRGE